MWLASSCGSKEGSDFIQEEEFSWFGNWFAYAEVSPAGEISLITSPQESYLLTITDTHLQLHDISANALELGGEMWAYTEAYDQLDLDIPLLSMGLARGESHDQEIFLHELRMDHTLVVQGLKFRKIDSAEAETYYEYFHQNKKLMQVAHGASARDQLETTVNQRDLNGVWELAGVRADQLSFGTEQVFPEGAQPRVFLVMDQGQAQMIINQGIYFYREHWQATLDNETLHLLTPTGRLAAKIDWLSASKQFMHIEPLVLKQADMLERYHRLPGLPAHLASLL